MIPDVAEMTRTAQPADILRLAAEMPVATADKMAHALGWPDHYQTREGTWGKYRGFLPREPWRNYYCGAPNDPDWRWAIDRGLATGWAESDTRATYGASAYGAEVVRARVSASVYAGQLRATYPSQLDTTRPDLSPTTSPPPSPDSGGGETP